MANRLKAVYDGDDLLEAMAYDGDGNRIFQLNYNLHTDDDWKGNSGNGNGNNKDNSGSGKSLWSMIVDFFTGGDEEETDPAMETESTAETEPTSQAESNDFTDPTASPSTFKLNDNGNNGNNGNGGNGNHYGWESGDGEDGEDPDDDSTGEDGTDGRNPGSGNTNNTGGSQNQSGILFPESGEVSELEEELIGMIKTTGQEKDYELVEYVNDVNRENEEVLMELNINGKMDTAYSYGNERLTVERFDGRTGYYTYDPRGSVSGVTGSDGYLWQSYRYDPFGDISFGKPQYNNVYAYNAESFNPNLDTIYLRARYYYTSTANFLSEDTYLGDISDPLTLNRYNYVKSSYLNYVDPSGNFGMDLFDLGLLIYKMETAIRESAESGESEVALYNSGGLEVKLDLAGLKSKIEDCGEFQPLASFAVGFELEGNKYFIITDSLSLGLDAGMARALKFAEATGVEEKLVNRFADPEMYYLGKFMASLINNIKSKAVVESVNDLTNLISNSSGNNPYFDDILKLFGVASAGQLASVMSGAVSGAGEAGGAAAVAAGGTVATTAAGGIVLTVGSIILVIEAEATNLQLSEAEIPKSAKDYNESKGESKTPDEVNYDSKQIGKKYGEHKADYPDMESYKDYKDLAEEIFNLPDQIIHDKAKGEYYYTKGNDLLRIKENGDFVSLYPGSESERVLNAIENGGVIWP